jgi:hypothetical protein
MNEKRMTGRTRRMGHVEMPAADIEFGRTYTIEFDHEDRYFRWTGARPARAGDTAIFEHGDGNGVIVEMSASLKKIFVRP